MSASHSAAMGHTRVGRLCWRTSRLSQPSSGNELFAPFPISMEKRFTKQNVMRGWENSAKMNNPTCGLTSLGQPPSTWFKPRDSVSYLKQDLKLATTAETTTATTTEKHQQQQKKNNNNNNNNRKTTTTTKHKQQRQHNTTTAMQHHNGNITPQRQYNTTTTFPYWRHALTFPERIECRYQLDLSRWSSRPKRHRGRCQRATQPPCSVRCSTKN